jgi:uncharacterized protein YwqG
MVDIYGEGPWHSLGGYSNPIHDTDMELECQLVSNGINLSEDFELDDPRVKALEEGRDDWTLLLQIDSDNSCEMSWGDDGTLYFWVKKDDLAAKRFDDVWMILQCY